MSALVGAEVMMFQGNPRAIPFVLAGGVSAILALFAWRRREMPRAPAFVTMMAGETVWALSEALELVVTSSPLQILCIDLRVVGAVTSVLGMLAFVLHYTRRERWLEPRRFGAICVLPLALVVVSWTNPWHRLFWSSIRWRARRRLRDGDPRIWTGILVGVRIFLHPGCRRRVPARRGGRPVLRGLPRPGRRDALRRAGALGRQRHRHVACIRSISTSTWPRQPSP